MLSGRVGGGCDRSIGDVTIAIRSETNCLVHVDTVSAAVPTYSVLLPPQTYLVSALAVEELHSGRVGQKRNVSNRVLPKSRRASGQAGDFRRHTRDFVYRAPPLQVVITGMGNHT